MKVDTVNNMYNVQFIKRTQVDDEGHSHVVTICKIFTINETQTGEYERDLIGVGESKQNPKDLYDHVFGKKLALQRALVASHFPAITYTMDRIEHTMVWQRFVEEFGSIDGGVPSVSDDKLMRSIIKEVLVWVSSTYTIVKNDGEPELTAEDMMEAFNEDIDANPMEMLRNAQDENGIA